MKTFISALLSVAVFFATCIIAAIIAGTIVGINDKQELNGGPWLAVVILVVGFASATIFNNWYAHR